MVQMTQGYSPVICFEAAPRLLEMLVRARPALLVQHFKKNTKTKTEQTETVPVLQRRKKMKSFPRSDVVQPQS